jgi:hypothetical protein
MAMTESERIAAIQGSAQLATTGVNAIAQANLNKKQREWNEKQYQLQRSHALQDWQMQQEYNSPTAQMKRLQDAGLNPNLIYGSGTSTLAQPVRGTETKSWTPQAPRLEAPNILGMYQDMRTRDVQRDLMKEDIQNRRQQRALLAAQVANTMASTDTKNFDLDLKRKFAEGMAEQATVIQTLNRQILEQDLQQGTIKTNTMQLQYDIANQLKNTTIVSATLDTLKKRVSIEKDQAEINRINTAIKQIEADTNLKKLDYDLYTQKGFTRNAPWYAKAVADAIESGNYTDLQATLRLIVEDKYPGQGVFKQFLNKLPSLKGKK